MKLSINTIFFLLIFSLGVSQDKSKELSNAEIFSSQAGTLIEKEFLDVGKINNNTEIIILKITNMISGDSIKSLRITTDIKGSYSTETKIAQLDSDEIDGLIKSLIIIKNKVLPINATNYTEISFKSRSGFEAGCYWSKNEWKIYLQIEKYDRKSLVLLKGSEFELFLELLNEVKTKM
ncbi:hypothetical protein [Cellulophaga tyrosinoxydans]|uniref:Uncharacterized protein n=1 Tax=Cellulophaga tyrosinoxydans TaxID=504486 RepID=A0A1W1YGP2_9FLAO|nr:hypothetical protein [Cellulophaga tyrosinoxydans]SMC35306.1 hypothetical protein SAMN05660703_0456 [Cellulophaga tyrosinoxydans]